MASKRKYTHLTPEQKDVLFNRQTETPFSGAFLHNKSAGLYVCAACGNKLFHSETKFDSGSGWPSFYDVADPKAVKLTHDTSQGMHRVEITCVNCGGHLGHVFNDAPDQPTGMRFCVNSLSLDFKSEEVK
ncbi:MAG: peptide-methionine (R)-S-oxide reductase MsrB [Candidatus Saccharibacteria bacterium]|nr:peptide-methionine (R)-S-oxide reductase MsrB [Candidatus Saccharibacteria bacterium]